MTHQEIIKKHTIPEQIIPEINAEHLISSEGVVVSTPSFEEALNHTMNQFRQAFTNLAKDD